MELMNLCVDIMIILLITNKNISIILERLTPDHLIPLDKNSGEVRVYLPYLDSELIEIYSWIPLYQKVDNNKRKRSNI